MHSDVPRRPVAIVATLIVAIVEVWTILAGGREKHRWKMKSTMKEVGSNRGRDMLELWFSGVNGYWDGERLAFRGRLELPFNRSAARRLNGSAVIFS